MLRRCPGWSMGKIKAVNRNGMTACRRPVFADSHQSATAARCPCLFATLADTFIQDSVQKLRRGCLISGHRQIRRSRGRSPVSFRNILMPFRKQKMSRRNIAMRFRNLAMPRRNLTMRHRKLTMERRHSLERNVNGKTRFPSPKQAHRNLTMRHRNLTTRRCYLAMRHRKVATRRHYIAMLHRWFAKCRPHSLPCGR